MLNKQVFYIKMHVLKHWLPF